MFFPLEMLGLNKVSGRCACPAETQRISAFCMVVAAATNIQASKLQREVFQIHGSLTVPFGLAVLTYELAFVLSASACLQHLSPAWSNPQLRQVP